MERDGIGEELATANRARLLNIWKCATDTVLKDTKISEADIEELSDDELREFIHMMCETIVSVAASAEGDCTEAK